jgi:nucleotide-binding universal stress UspA family protein
MMQSGGVGPSSHRRNSQTATVGTHSTVAVVIGLDGSASSWDAFWWACGETRRLGARALAIFVSPVPGANVSADAAGAFVLMERTSNEIAEGLRLQAETYGAEHDVDVTFMHARGDAAQELLRIATVYGADQIVVGRSTKARHHFAGSLGRRLVSKNKAPVVVVVP